MMRNPFASHTDYQDFYGVIGSNPYFLPSNVDGICERKGKFLVMEWKRENEQISKGQEYLLKAFAKLPNFIVLIIYGDTDNGTNVQKYYLVNQDGSCTMAGTGFESLKQYYLQWYEYADQS
ncbi:hypothetical protein UFOVP192_3 [uncultured Caudovirales phage]|uniref:Uncharacterized protein n=1 Tax=uncultured Caudovirales phage TaxID=2100421 RepID=A0A6J7WLR7_9CAUD|nr:hypothetical protein UFOVP192_3 [uncultured Caudovirales phage]